MARKKRRRRVPPVACLLLRENSGTYHVRYDCPWCGQEHEAEINQVSAIEIVTPCAKKILIHRIEQIADDESQD